MAERRMMSKKIIHSDAFLDMPATSQNLYFHLLLEADDEGFVNSPKRIQRTVGATDGDAQMLLLKKFILSFESGVIVIKHWRMHNYIQNDRFKATSHKDERAKLEIRDNQSYTLSKDKENVSISDTNCTPSIEEDSIDKISIGEDSIDTLSDAPTVSSTYEDTIILESIKYLNHMVDSNYKPSTPKTRTLIKARIKEGFTLNDFYTVIDKKVSQWKNDPKMSTYLRPETLFGTKFEGYLNEIVPTSQRMDISKLPEGISLQDMLNAAGEEWEREQEQKLIGGVR